MQKQIRKQRQTTKRAVDEVELSVPTTKLAETDDAAELLARLDEILEV